MDQVMIDIETLDIAPTAIVLSIAAVKFDKDKIIEPNLYLVPHIQPQINAGRTFSEDTLLWWMEQRDDVRNLAFTRNRGSIEVCLDTLNDYVKDCKGVWAYPVSFDLVILKDLYRMWGRKPGWFYRSEREVRVLKELFNIEKREGNHNPVTDCITQIEVVQQAMKKAEIACLL